MPDIISLNNLETFGLTMQTLVQELENAFPPTNPTPDETLSKIMFRSGQRSVVEYIQQRIQEDYG